MSENCQWSVCKNYGKENENLNLAPRDMKKKSCSTQLSMIFFLFINVKMPTIVGILIFMSRNNCILGLSETEKNADFLYCLYLRAFKISCSAELSMA